MAEFAGVITENQLDEWVRGNARDAQGVIVELVWRLVAASSPNPKERRFPLGDSIGQHGPDGVLEVYDSFGPFVPGGYSFWEIGTGLDAAAKATSDYNSLTTTIPQNIRFKSTFVFVTPLSGRRDWEYTWKKDSQAAWLEERRRKGEWLDVRVIDGTKLVDWMHHFPSVELWFLWKCWGRGADQLETLEQHWDIIKSIGEPPPLPPQLFLANREDTCRCLKEVFGGNQTRLSLDTHFPSQVVDFVAACWAVESQELQKEIAGRCLIITGTEGWDSIVAQREKHILIAHPNLDLGGDLGTKLIQKAKRAGHSLIFCGNIGGIPDPTKMRLREPRSHQIKEALEKSGYREERARTMAEKSGGNLSSLLRLLQNLSSMPEWSQGTEKADIAIAAFIGTWNDNSEADRSALEKFLGKKYGEWIEKIRDMALAPSTPLIQREGAWKFVPRYEGWYSLGLRLSDEHLDRLRDVAALVLGEKDPKFYLPPEDRFAASIHGKILSHSPQLREGLAECLALLGSHPSALTSCSRGKAESSAAHAVRFLLNNADWVLWASLERLLPLLAEAAPEEFMEAMEKALGNDPCPFDRLFAQEGDGALGGGSLVSGLLWALETLAWDDKYLARVVVLLGKLAARDPGGTYANRPANSLTTILLPWMPQTCASIERRKVAVSILARELPDVGWKLLMALLPRAQSMSMGSRRPAWRSSIPNDWDGGVTYAEMNEQHEYYAQAAVEIALNSYDKMINLVKRLDHLPPPALARLMNHLGSDAVLRLSDSERLPLWTELTALATKHKRFSDAEWAIGQEWVEKIGEVAENLAPRDPFSKHQRLFSERDFELYEENGNWEKQSNKLKAFREAAIGEIVSLYKMKGLLEFASSVKSPWRAGFAAGVVAYDQADGEILPTLLFSSENGLATFAAGYVLGRFQARGWCWIDGLDKSGWDIQQLSQFLSYLPFQKGTWDRSEKLLAENEGQYWTKASANPYEADTGLEYAINKLIEHGRPHAAIRCLGKMQFDKEVFDNSLAINALLAGVESNESPNLVDTYEIVELIKMLQDDPKANKEDVFNIEWAYLKLLEHDDKAYPKLMEMRLATEPEFFCEIIRLVFHSKHDPKRTEEPSDKEKKIGGNAYRLLNGWRTPPGIKENGTYDEHLLGQWLSAVKTKSRETGHHEVAMTMMGQVLTYAPADSSGLWINKAVAVVLDADDAKDMRDGFCMKLANSRGVHWVDPTAKPEKELAAKYRSQADAVELAGFHRLAISLRDLASSYDRQAEQIIAREEFDV